MIAPKDDRGGETVFTGRGRRASSVARVPAPSRVAIAIAGVLEQRVRDTEARVGLTKMPGELPLYYPAAGGED